MLGPETFNDEMVFPVAALPDVPEFCDGREFGTGEGAEAVEVQPVDGDAAEEA